MAAKIYYQEDCNLSLLEGKTIAIIGYGSQGHAHALNLKESGCNVVIGLYEGSRSWAKAEAQGFEVYTAAEAAKKADIIMILINDEKQAALYKNDIEPNLEEGNMLMFAHGFNIHFGQIVPPANVDVTMIAPKAPGHTVRSEYQVGKGTPCLVAVEQDYTGKALDKALAYGLAIGGARAGILETTSVSKPACIRAHTPPQRTACSPKRSVSVSVRNVVSRIPALAPPIARPYARALSRAFRRTGGSLRRCVRSYAGRL